MPRLHLMSHTPRRRPGTLLARHRWAGRVEPADMLPWVQPGSLTARPSAPRLASPPAPEVDPIAIALAAADRHGRHEGALGMLLALGMVALLVMGWLLPLLAVASLAAPVVGLALGLFGSRPE